MRLGEGGIGDHHKMASCGDVLQQLICPGNQIGADMDRIASLAEINLDASMG